MTAEHQKVEKEPKERKIEIIWSPAERALLTAPSEYTLSSFKEWTKGIRFDLSMPNFTYYDTTSLSAMAWIEQHLRAGWSNEVTVSNFGRDLPQDRLFRSQVNPELERIMETFYHRVIIPYFQLVVLPKPEIERLAKAKGIKITNRKKEELIEALLDYEKR